MKRNPQNFHCYKLFLYLKGRKHFTRGAFFLRVATGKLFMSLTFSPLLQLQFGFFFDSDERSKGKGNSAVFMNSLQNAYSFLSPPVCLNTVTSSHKIYSYFVTLEVYKEIFEYVSALHVYIYI